MPESRTDLVANEGEIDNSSEFDPSRFHVHVHYSHHESKEDFRKLGKLLKSDEFDIYVPEAPGHDEHLRFAIDSMVAGDSEVYQHFKKYFESNNAEDPFWQRLKTLYCARKIVIYPDFDKEEIAPLNREKVVHGEMVRTGDFATDFGRYKDKIAGMAAYFNIRDDRVAECLPTLLQEAIRENPELAGKEKIGVLVSIGIWHTGLGHRLSRAGFGLERSFQSHHKTYDFHGEAIRSAMFTGDVDDTVAIRGFIENYFPFAFDTSDHGYRDALHRQVANNLTETDIKELSETYVKDPIYFLGLLEKKIALDKLLRSPKVKIAPAMSAYRKELQRAKREAKNK